MWMTSIHTPNDQINPLHQYHSWFSVLPSPSPPLLHIARGNCSDGGIFQGPCQCCKDTPPGRGHCQHHQQGEIHWLCEEYEVLVDFVACTLDPPTSPLEYLYCTIILHKSSEGSTSGHHVSCSQSCMLPLPTCEWTVYLPI